MIAQQLVEALLPFGGVLVSLAHAYIDESGTDDDSPQLCLAGYVFHHDRAMLFSKEWAAMLQRYDLPAFHMTDCNAGRGDFKKLSKDECIAVQTEAIRLITKRSALGFAVTVNEKEYQEIYAPLSKDRWSAYYFCLNNCLTAVKAWVEKTKFDGRVAYFFEAGHRDAGVANERMTAIFKGEKLRNHFHYSTHAFGGKTDFPPLQAADVLAWQWFKNTKRALAGATKPRSDLLALVRPYDEVMTYDRAKLIEAREFTIANAKAIRENDPSFLAGEFS